MELTHDFTVPAAVDVAWAVFMDLEGVGRCFPGATVTEVTEDGFSGTVKVKLGPIALVYAGAGRFLSRDDATHRAVIEAKGKDKRGNGTAGATVTIQLAPSGEGTRIDVATDLAVTGKPAQFGRGVMQDVSDKLLGQFVGCIEGRFADLAPPAPEAVPAEGASVQDVAAEGLQEGVPAEVAGPASLTHPPFIPAPSAGAPGPAAGGSVDSIDLGSTVLPVLVRQYAGRTAVAVIAFVVGYLFGRR